MPRPTRKTQDKSSDAGEAKSSRQRAKSRAGERAPLKDVKNEDRSGNVYENKGPSDNLPDTKDDISARLHAILHRKYTYFAETVGSFATFRALRNESLTSKCRNSSRY